MTPADDPISAETRQRILAAARRTFIAEGYRVGVDAIAEAAGVAKQTLYNHFAGKEELFVEALTVARESVAVGLESDTGALRASLIRYALAFREKVLNEETLALFRVLVAEMPRLPELARAFYVKGPESCAAQMSGFLQRAMDEGLLRRDDPRFVAEMLLSQLTGFDHIQRLCGGAPRRARDERARVEKIVDQFLRACAA